MLETPIIIQKQPTPVTCVHACLAMCLGVPVEDVISVFGDQAMNGQDLIVALTRCRVLFNPMAFGTLLFDGYYFAVVPSLNHRGGNHQVILHSKDWNITVFDPSTMQAYREDGKDLVSWSELIPFLPGGTLPKTK